jgi:ribulose-5-phosphate 4-epimerase/fuculose-1-phosphate aldolase
MRIDGENIAITVSGRHKGRLTPDDVMVIDANGEAVGTTAKPSAETPIFTRVFQIPARFYTRTRGHKRLPASCLNARALLRLKTMSC